MRIYSIPCHRPAFRVFQQETRDVSGPIGIPTVIAVLRGIAQVDLTGFPNSVLSAFVLATALVCSTQGRNGYK